MSQRSQETNRNEQNRERERRDDRLARRDDEPELERHLAVAIDQATD